MLTSLKAADILRQQRSKPVQREGRSSVLGPDRPAGCLAGRVLAVRGGGWGVGLETPTLSVDLVIHFGQM